MISYFNESYICCHKCCQNFGFPYLLWPHWQASRSIKIFKNIFKHYLFLSRRKRKFRAEPNHEHPRKGMMAIGHFGTHFTQYLVLFCSHFSTDFETKYHLWIRVPFPFKLHQKIGKIKQTKFGPFFVKIMMKNFEKWVKICIRRFLLKMNAGSSNNEKV